MLNLAELSAITLVDADEKPQALGELWRDQTVVLAFIRHFG
jgi:hypothetical protein